MYVLFFFSLALGTSAFFFKMSSSRRCFHNALNTHTHSVEAATTRFGTSNVKETREGKRAKLSRGRSKEREKSHRNALGAETD